MKNNTAKLKITICGYYGFGNLGDELILSHLCKTLHSTTNTSVKLFILSNSPKETQKTHKVKVFNRFNPFTVFFAIMRSGVFLLGGGGIIQDKTSSASLYYYLTLCLLAKLLGKEVIVFAVGVNPLKKFNRTICSMVLNMSKCVIVRDKFSYDYLKKIGVGTKNLTLGVDPVFTQPITKAKSKPNQVLFVLRKQESITGLDGAIANFASFVYKKTLTPVTLGYFQKTDFEFCKNISELLPNDVKQGNALEFSFENLNLFSNVNFVLTQRYHGAVLAIKAGIPFIALSDDEKLVEIAREFSQFVVSPSALNCADSLTKAFDVLWQNYTTYSQNIEYAGSELEPKARQATEFLYRCVNLI